MKYQNIFLVLFLSSLFTISLQAQFENWAAEGSHWVYHTTNFGALHESEGHFSIGQEMKAGKLCQKITNNNSYIYVYEEDSNIFMWYEQSNNFVQIYDWDAVEGDSYDCSRANFSGEEIAQTCIIENIDTIFIDDIAYQEQTIVVHNNEDSTILCPWTKVIVGIGGTEYFGVPLAINFPSVEQWTYLICHTNPQGNTSTITEIEGAETCAFLVETEEVKLSFFDFKLAPNPVQQELKISLKDHNAHLRSNVSFQIVNQQGQIIKNFRINPNEEITYIIDVRLYTSGIYFLQYLENEKIILSETFMKL